MLDMRRRVLGLDRPRFERLGKVLITRLYLDVRGRIRRPPDQHVESVPVGAIGDLLPRLTRNGGWMWCATSPEIAFARNRPWSRTAATKPASRTSPLHAISATVGSHDQSFVKGSYADWPAGDSSHLREPAGESRPLTDEVTASG